MRYAVTALLLAAGFQPALGQTRFQPAMLYHTTFAGVLAYGEVVPLHQEPGAGQVSLAARLYSVTHPRTCQDEGGECRVAYFVVVHDPRNVDGPLVWSLGWAGPVRSAEWLPPSPGMAARHGRLRLHVAALDRRLADGVFQDIEFEVGYDGAWVR